MSAPWPPLRRPCGIHRRTAGLLARGVSPAPPSRTYEKSSGEKSAGTPLTVAGAATDRRKACRVPFSPSGKPEGPCLGSCSSFARGCQIEGRTLSRASAPTSRDTPSIDRRPARTSAGISSSGFGGEPRSPNRVLSSHSVVILASATTGLHVEKLFSASADRLSGPNSVSANRRSISFCSQARASRVFVHGEAAPAEAQNLALIPIRLDARTTAGAHTTAETRPWRNRRRGTISELIFPGPRVSTDEYTRTSCSQPSTPDGGRTDLVRLILPNSKF